MPGVSLPAGCEIYYNGYSFGVMTAVTGVRVKPNLDSAGRTVVSVTHTYTIESTLTIDPPAPGGSTTSDTHLETVRRQLSHDGGEFRFRGHGFSDLHVNQPGGGGVRDLSWGPHVRDLAFVHMGGDQAWKIHFTIETTILECQGAQFRNAPLEFCYHLGWVVDKLGFTTRTYAGHVYIPEGRLTAADRRLHDTADKYLEQVLPGVSPGFRREVRQRDLDDSKCKLNFTVTDTELQGYCPPKDCVISSLAHSSSTQGAGFMKWVDTCRGRYTMARSVSRARAWSVFWTAVLDRMMESLKWSKSVVPLSLNLEGGDLYGPDSGSFTVVYSRILKEGQRGNAIQACQIWRAPPQGDNFITWGASMQAAGVFEPRGYAKLKFSTRDDRLVDLCGAAKTLPLPDPAAKPPKIIRVAPDEDERGERDPVNPLNMKTPAPADSWLAWEQELIVREVDNVVALYPLPTEPVGYSSPGGAFNSTEGWKSGYAPSQATRPIIQTRGGPQLVGILRGRAMRLSYPISPPAVTEIGGVPVVPANDGSDVFRTRTVGNLGVPVVAAVWARKYILADVPRAGLAAPEDPFDGEVRDDQLTGWVAQRR